MSDHPREPDERDELAGLEDLSPDDPRVAESGPRVRAHLRAHREFVAPSEVPEGARVDEAERRLSQMLERELGVPLSGDARDPVEPPPDPAPMPGFWTMILGPQMRPVFGAAVLIALVGGIWLFQSSHKAEPVLRGSETSAHDTDLASVTVTKTDGSIRLEWLAPAAARSYTIVFQSPELEEIARVADLHDTHYELRAGALPAGLASGSEVLWQVIAMRGGDEIARSKTTAITVP